MKRPEKKRTPYDLSFELPEFVGYVEDLEEYIDYLESQDKFPNTKEVEEAAESFGALYAYDAEFANGCEWGWKKGAEWMKAKTQRSE